MEYNGTLHDYISENKTLSWDRKIKILKDIAHALQTIIIDKQKAKIKHPIFLELSAAISLSSMEEQIDGITIYRNNVAFIDQEVIKNPYLKFKSKSDSVREKPVIGTPVSYADLYRKCWKDDSECRPTMQEICDQLEILQEEPFYIGEEIPDCKEEIPDCKEEEIPDCNEKYMNLSKGGLRESFKRILKYKNPSKVGLRKQFEKFGSEKKANERFYDLKELTNVKIIYGEFGMTMLKAKLGGYGTTVAFKSLKVNANSDELYRKFKFLQRASFHSNIIHLYDLAKNEEATKKPLNRLLEKAMLEQKIAYFDSFEFSDVNKVAKGVYKASWKNYGIMVTLKCFKVNDKSLKEKFIELYS
ncbi:16344_t:CDS:2, partial [Cetraspora pellucida]